MKKYINNLNQKISKYVYKGYSVKKSALHLLTWNIKILFSRVKIKSSFKDKVVHIGVIPRGAIGDYAYIAKYLYALKQKFGDLIEIDLLFHDKKTRVAEILFKGDYIHRVYSDEERQLDYDCEISVQRFPQIEFIDNERFNRPEFKAILDYLMMLNRFCNQYHYIFLLDGVHYSLMQQHSRENQPDIKNFLDMKKINNFFIPFSADEKSVLSKFTLEADQYITLQTGGGKWISDSKIDTRTWAIENYNQLILRLNQAFPHYRIVQIGDDHHSIMENTDLNLLGKTNFSDLMVILKNSKLHISQEGGMPILRHFLNRKPSCVLYGPSNKKLLAFPENINISANLPCTCEGVVTNWAKKCDIYDKPLCMQKITVDMVMDEIRKVL